MTGEESVWKDPGAFRQRVRMVAVQVEGLRPEELARALAYELEPASGIPADEAEVVWRPADEADSAFRAFEVAVLRRTRRRGGRGIGVLALRLLPMFGVLAFVGVMADGAWLWRRRGACAQAVCRREPLERRLQELRRRKGAVEGALAEFERAREEAVASQRRCAELRAAFPEMMDAVAGSFGGRAVVKALEPLGPFAVRVCAVAADAATAADVQVAMSEALAVKGWTLDPGPVQAAADGAVVAFSCELRREGGER